MGSSPILAQGAPGSSVGRARTQRKMHLVYIAGWSSRLARLAHYQKVSGSNPLPATKSVWAYLTLIKMPDSVNTDFVSFNYHFLLAELSLVTAWRVCGFAANALSKRT